MAQQVLNNGEGGAIIRGKINDNFTELYNGIPVLADNLIEWAQGKDYEPLVITRDSEGIVTEMTVVWPDGSAGVYTSTDWNATHECYDGYIISHTDSGVDVVQDPVTRDSEGAIIYKPALTIV